MASTDWITGIVMIKYANNFHHPMYHCVPICDKKCFMIFDNDAESHERRRFSVTFFV